MSDPAKPSLETVLHLIAAAAPQPWYPFDYVRAHGVARDSIDPHLDHLRLGGLVRLTDWVGGHGQGYALTPEGTQALANPRHLAQLQNGQVPHLEGAADSRPASTGPASAWERGEEIRQALMTPTAAIYTKVLVALNILVFVAGFGLAITQGVPLNKYVAWSDPGIAYQTGALTGNSLLQGEWWRLLTTCFVHFGCVHLGVNMFALYRLGPIAERLWGPRRFLILYLLAGIGGSCAVVTFTPHVLCAGASGAICGVIGAEAGWLFLNRAFLPPPLVSSWTRNLLINSVLIVVVSSIPGVSKEAHYGGAAIGLVVAFLLNAQRFGAPQQRWLAVVGLFVVPVVCVGFVVRAMNQSPEWQSEARSYERLAFGQEYVSDILRDCQGLLVLYEDRIVPLLPAKHAPDPKEEQDIRGALALQRNYLATLADRLKQQHPYNSLQVDSLRTLSQETVEAFVQLCEKADRAVQSGPNRPEDVEALRQQFDQTEKLWLRWAKEGKDLGLVK